VLEHAHSPSLLSISNMNFNLKCTGLEDVMVGNICDLILSFLRSKKPYVNPRNERTLRMRKYFFEEIRKMELPGNCLDELLDKLGGTENVAELTGRKKR
jgi:hypothetical protein